MTSLTQSGPTARTAPARRLAASWSRARRGLGAEARIATLLGLMAVVVLVLVFLAPTETPFSSLMIPLILGSILLSPRTLPWFVIFLMALLTLAVSQQVTLTSRTVGAVVVQFLLGFIVLVTGFRRARLGVAGLRGESMFVDLRDRILSHGGIPDLPADWVVESALHSAGGTAFAGDFVVASRTTDGRCLRLVVVDVSGKGVDAGTRALLLSGAFGGMLGALPDDDFLPAANDYLLRQDWDEGFASAIHLVVDLASGGFEVRSAGHPPAVLRAANGDWSSPPGDGPVLGLIPGADFAWARGRLDAGDTLMLYTDGMVERPHVDIETGVEIMVDLAGRLIAEAPVGAAERLAHAAGSRSDDRAVVVVHRRA